MVRPCLKTGHISCDFLIVDIMIFRDILVYNKCAISKIEFVCYCVGNVGKQLSVQALFQNFSFHLNEIKISINCGCEC